MEKLDLDAYKKFIDTHEYSEFKTKQMRKNQFDIEDPYEMDDEDEPVSEWVKELMMDDEEYIKLQTKRLLAERKRERGSDK